MVPIYELLITFTKRLDSFLCHYLGIHKEKIRFQSFRLKNNSFIVTYAIPFKRHVFRESLNSLHSTDLIKSHRKVNNKVGLAAGKSIAKGLIISFEEVEIDSHTSE